MFDIEALNARHGDSIMVSWSIRSGIARMLIDGGPSGAWLETIRPRLLRMIDDGKEPLKIALVVVSHIDDDHIEGIIQLLKELRAEKDSGRSPSVVIENIWHNTLIGIATGQEEVNALTASDVHDMLQFPVVAITESVKQGEAVRFLSQSLAIPRNAGIGADGIISSGVETEFYGLGVKVVCPRKSELTAQWNEWRRRSGTPEPNPASAAGFVDSSVFNAASIVLYLTFGERTALLTGDVRGDYLLAGLVECGLLDTDGRLHVNLLKVPHHGSRNNATPEMYQVITADHYVISASGRHGHPDKELLDWIIDSNDRSSFTIHLTNSIVTQGRKSEQKKNSYDVQAYLAERQLTRNFGVVVRQESATGVVVSLQ